MLLNKVRLIEGAYVQLEDAYCLRSVEEAMRIAEPIEVRRDGVWCGVIWCRGVKKYATVAVVATPVVLANDVCAWARRA